MLELPPPVRDAYDRAAAAGFEYSSEALVGRLLATLSSGLILATRRRDS